MNIEVKREACCAQDDQLGPLRLKLDLPESSTIQELAKLIGESGFLQFSGTHNIIIIRSGGVELLSIPSLANEECSVQYTVAKLELAKNHIKDSVVECNWPKDL